MRGRPLDIERELLEAFRHSCLVTEYLIVSIPRALWRAKPPSGRGRTIAGIVAHIQSVRRTFARMGGANPGPPPLDQKSVSIPQARKALRGSTDQLGRFFEAALREQRSRVRGMPRRAVDMLTYLMQHDAHHRGQIFTLARDLGHEFGKDDVMRVWGWKALAKATDSDSD